MVKQKKHHQDGRVPGATRYELLVTSNPFKKGKHPDGTESVRRYGRWPLLVKHNNQPGNIAAVRQVDKNASLKFFDECNERGLIKLHADTEDPRRTGDQLHSSLAQESAILEAAGYYSPSTEKEQVRRVLREIVARQGQPRFRSALINAYCGRCLVTGCDAEPALEAAHIIPYSESALNDVTNGLLLRADIHTLFDLGLLGIEPMSLTIEVAELLLESEYRVLNGRPLVFAVDSTIRPSREALMSRYKTGQ